MSYIVKYLSKGAENNEWSVIEVADENTAMERKAFLEGRNYEVRVYCGDLVEVNLESPPPLIRGVAYLVWDRPDRKYIKFYIGFLDGKPMFHSRADTHSPIVGDPWSHWEIFKQPKEVSDE